LRTLSGGCHHQRPHKGGINCDAIKFWRFWCPGRRGGPRVMQHKSLNRRLQREKALNRPDVASWAFTFRFGAASNFGHKSTHSSLETVSRNACEGAELAVVGGSARRCQNGTYQSNYEIRLWFSLEPTSWSFVCLACGRASKGAA